MLTIELSETVNAPRQVVWGVLSNVLRQREYTAYEITEARQTNAAELGPEFRWNEKGVLLGKRYDCECRIFGWEPPEWLCFGTKSLFHISYELEINDGQTMIAYRCELPQTRAERRDAITKICRQSLSNLKAIIERKAVTDSR